MKRRNTIIECNARPEKTVRVTRRIGNAMTGNAAIRNIMIGNAIREA
jgi:hypothetical protein